MERKVNGYLRSWLGVPQSFTSIRLYRNSIKLRIPVSSVVKEFKVANCRMVMTLRDSADDIGSRKGQEENGQQKHGPSRELAILLRIIGNTNTGGQGVGVSYFQQRSKASTAERRTMVQFGRNIDIQISHCAYIVFFNTIRSFIVLINGECVILFLPDKQLVSSEYESEYGNITHLMRKSTTFWCSVKLNWWWW